MFVDTHAGQIHCRMAGEGEPVVVLHQIPMSSSEFSDALPILGDHYWALAMDFPLFGDSYKPVGELRVENLAEAVLEFMDALDIKKAHVVGHHMGACVAVELTSGHPERVDKMALSACPSWTQEQGDKLLGSGKYKKLKITPDGWFMQYIWDYAMERIPRDRINAAYDLALDFMKAGSRSEEGHRAALRYDIIPKLKKMKHRTLVVCGDKDLCYPYYETTLKLIPHAQGKIIKNGPAQTPRLFPEEWARVVLEFLRDQ